MKKKLIPLGVIAVLGGIAAGIHYEIPVVIALVLVFLAVFSAVCGIQMIVTRKADIPTSDSFDPHREYHTGLSAQLYGLLFVMFSVPIGAFGILYWMHGGDPPGEIIDSMVKSPLISGVAIVAVGAGLAMYGLTRVLPGKAAFVETKISLFERSLNAIYLCGVGAVLMLAGIVRVAAPGTLTRLRDAGIAWVLHFFK